MCLVVGVSKPLARHVGVDLSGRDVGVPEELLNLAQSGPTVEQVRRKAVPEGVGRDVGANARLLNVVLDDQLQPLARQPPPSWVEEHRFLRRVQLARHTAFSALRAEPRGAPIVHGDDPLLRALAEAAHGPGSQIDVFSVQGNELADAHAVRVQHF